MQSTWWAEILYQLPRHKTGQGAITAPIAVRARSKNSAQNLILRIAGELHPDARNLAIYNRLKDDSGPYQLVISSIEPNSENPQ